MGQFTSRHDPPGMMDLPAELGSEEKYAIISTLQREHATGKICWYRSSHGANEWMLRIAHKVLPSGVPIILHVSLQEWATEMAMRQE